MPTRLACCWRAATRRGDATPHSDIDLIRFAAVLPEAEADRYTLAYREGRLVSLSTTTIDAKRNELSRPGPRSGRRRDCGKPASCSTETARWRRC